jgi:hypothetical protein
MMSNTLNNVLIFAAGVAVGALVSYKVFKTKYEIIVQEESESFRETYNRMKAEHEAEMEEYEAIERAKKPDLSEYRNKLKEQGYVGYSEEETEEVTKVERPYVISPSEYGELDGYETVSLTYFKDGVLTTDYDDEEVDYVDDVVGLDSLEHFGEYDSDPDTVFVRNDRLKVDYEIMRDNRNYSDVVNMPPHNVEDE